MSGTPSTALFKAAQYTLARPAVDVQRQPRFVRSRRDSNPTKRFTHRLKHKGLQNLMATGRRVNKVYYSSNVTHASFDKTAATGVGVKKTI